MVTDTKNQLFFITWLVAHQGLMQEKGERKEAVIFSII
jgi:hypothetical protein